MRIYEGIREYLGTRLWVPPATGVIVALLLAAVTVTVDRRWTPVGMALPLTYAGSVATARTLLATIAGATVTLLALIFTILTIVLHVAVSQYSPRALRSLMQDAPAHFTIGTFITTFSYTLVVLTALRADGGTSGGEPFVASLSVTIALGLAILSLAVFAVFSSHISHSVRATSVIGRIAERTRLVLDRRFDSRDTGEADGRPPESADRQGASDAGGSGDVLGEARHVRRGRDPRWSSPGEPGHVVRADAPGTLVRVDEEGLVAAAAAADCILEMVPSVGDFVPAGGALVRVHGSVAGDDGIRRHLAFAPERTLEQDTAFGFRLLVDIAERALSPSVNDPTTAVQVVDQLHDLLGRIGTAAFPSRVCRGDDGEPRLLVQERRWEDFVDLAVDEIRHYGEGSIQVVRRLRAMLLDLLSTVGAARRPPLERQLHLLDAMMLRSFPDALDRAKARSPDLQGIGGP